MTDPMDVERLWIRGPDAVSYVDSQCTQDLATIAVGEASVTLVLAPDGTVVTAAVARRSDDLAVCLDVPIGCGAATAARLERFAIRADVTFEGPERVDATGPYPASELARIIAAWPGAAELARGLVPHALDEGLRARCVSFTKGCYPGQELVARMEARHATPPYVLRRCTLDGPGAPGDPVGDASKDGVLTSVALDEATSTWWGLCVVHRRDTESATAEVRTTPAVVARFE